MKKLQEQQLEQLSSFFRTMVKRNKATTYYVNPLNNGKSDFDKAHPYALKRAHNSYCNWTYIDYLDYGNGYKGWNDRKWYYVTQTEDENIVQIRMDLVDVWARENEHTNEVIILSPNGVRVINMSRFFEKSELNKVIRWNKEGNVVYVYDISSVPLEKLTEPATKEDIEWINQEQEWIGKCNYSRFRKDKAGYVLASYNEDGTLRNYHNVKSASQVFELLQLSLALDTSLRTFQRRVLENPTFGYFFEAAGRKYWIRAVTPADNCIPQVWGQEQVIMDENMNVQVNIKEDKQEQVIEEKIKKFRNRVNEGIKNGEFKDWHDIQVKVFMPLGYLDTDEGYEFYVSCMEELNNKKEKKHGKMD